MHPKSPTQSRTPKTKTISIKFDAVMLDNLHALQERFNFDAETIIGASLQTLRAALSPKKSKHELAQDELERRRAVQLARLAQLSAPSPPGEARQQECTDAAMPA